MRISTIAEGILFEAGLSRVLTHSQGSPFCILTAFRADNSLKQNRSLNRQLEGRFRQIGAGGIKLIGHWQEAPDGVWMGHNFDEIDPNQLVDTTEESYFVPIPRDIPSDTFKQWVVDTIVEFNQDAAVFSDGQSVFLVDKSGELIHIGSKITPGKIAQAYSSIRGKNFIFEGSVRPNNSLHKFQMHKRGLYWV